MFIAILHVRLRTLAIAALPVLLAWTATRLGPMENPVGWTVRSFGDSAPAIWHLEEDIAVESPDGEPLAGGAHDPVLLRLAPEGEFADTIRSGPESTADTTDNPTDVARSFWNAWARSDTTVMRRLSTGLVAFTPGERARIDSVIVEETDPARLGQDRAVVPTRLGMSAGRSSFVISFQTTLVGGADRWRVEQLETTRALSLAYIEVMADQLRRVGDALEGVRGDTTDGTR